MFMLSVLVGFASLIAVIAAMEMFFVLFLQKDDDEDPSNP